MSKYKVLLTDYAWPDIDIERDTLAEIDAELLVADQTDPASLAALVTDVNAIMTCWAQVTSQVIAAANRIQIVSRLGIGLDNIDVDYCSRNDIPVTNIPDYCVIEVAEHALSLLLSMARKIAFYHHATKSGEYDLQAGPPIWRIEGQTLGIIGLGNIGRRLASKAQGLGMRVIAFDAYPGKPEEGVEFCELDHLLASSDYVTLHVPLTEETHYLIGAAQLQQMKSSAYLINTARGGLVDPAALAAALSDNQLAGAALDVQDPEPPDLSIAPYTDPRVIVTPHAAFTSQESLIDLRSRVAVQVATCLAGGTPENVVNADALA